VNQLQCPVGLLYEHAKQVATGLATSKWQAKTLCLIFDNFEEQNFEAPKV